MDVYKERHYIPPGVQEHNTNSNGKTFEESCTRNLYLTSVVFTENYVCQYLLLITT